MSPDDSTWSDLDISAWSISKLRATQKKLNDQLGRHRSIPESDATSEFLHYVNIALAKKLASR